MVQLHWHRVMAWIIIMVLGSGLAGLNACPAENLNEQAHLLWINTPPTGPGMMEIYGEVAAISATEIAIDNGNRRYQLPLASQVQIFCNGLPAIWQALQPVTPTAFFEAKVIVNRQNEVIFIAGLYWGEICVIKSWRMEQANFYLKLFSVDSGRTCWRMLRSDAKVPGTGWLDQDIEIYALYNYQQNIRAVFLPD